MLINPTAHDFALRWHRDDIRENASEEEERSSLSVWHHGVRGRPDQVPGLTPSLLSTYRFSGTRNYDSDVSDTCVLIQFLQGTL